MTREQIAAEIAASEQKLADLRARLQPQTGWWLVDLARPFHPKPLRYLGRGLHITGNVVTETSHTATFTPNVIYWGTF